MTMLYDPGVMLNSDILSCYFSGGDTMMSLKEVDQAATIPQIIYNIQFDLLFKKV